MRADIYEHVCGDLIRKVELFQNCPRSFLRHLCMEVKAAAFMPGDFICLQVRSLISILLGRIFESFRIDRDLFWNIFDMCKVFYKHRPGSTLLSFSGCIGATESCFAVLVHKCLPMWLWMMLFCFNLWQTVFSPSVSMHFNLFITSADESG